MARLIQILESQRSILHQCYEECDNQQQMMSQMDDLCLESGDLLHVLQEFVEDEQNRGKYQQRIFSVQHEVMQSFLGQDGNIRQGNIYPRSDGLVNAWRRKAIESQSGKQITTVSDMSNKKRENCQKL